MQALKRKLGKVGEARDATPRDTDRNIKIVDDGDVHQAMSLRSPMNKTNKNNGMATAVRTSCSTDKTKALTPSPAPLASSATEFSITNSFMTATEWFVPYYRLLIA